MRQELPLSPRHEEALRIASSLIESIRLLSKTFPEEEDMGLVIEIRDAVMELHKAVMMAGHVGNREDFLAYTDDTRGKGAVLRTHLDIAREIGYCTNTLHTELITSIDRLGTLMEPPKKPKLRLV